MLLNKLNQLRAAKSDAESIALQQDVNQQPTETSKEIAKNSEKNDVVRGIVVSSHGNIAPAINFKAKVCHLTIEEGGDSTSLISGLRYMFRFEEAIVSGVITLRDNISKCKPGERIDLTINLDTPVSIKVGMDFKILDLDRIVSTGVVIDIIQQEKELQYFILPTPLEDAQKISPELKKAYWENPLDFEAICRFAKKIAIVSDPIRQPIKFRKEVFVRTETSIWGNEDEIIKIEDREYVPDGWILGFKYQQKQEQKGKYTDILKDEYYFILKNTGELIIDTFANYKRVNKNGKIISEKSDTVPTVRTITTSDIQLYDWDSSYELVNNGYMEIGNNKIFNNNTLKQHSDLLFAHQGEGLVYLLHKLPKKSINALEKELSDERTTYLLDNSSIDEWLNDLLSP
jgi:hypothetical protein